MIGEPWFEVEGSRNGSSVHLRWSTDWLAGDPPTVDQVLAAIEIAQTATAFAADPQLYGDSLEKSGGINDPPLSDPITVFAFVERVLGTVCIVNAEPPELRGRLRSLWISRARHRR